MDNGLMVVGLMTSQREEENGDAIAFAIHAKRMVRNTLWISRRCEEHLYLHQWQLTMYKGGSVGNSEYNDRH